MVKMDYCISKALKRMGYEKLHRKGGGWKTLENDQISMEKPAII